MPFNDSWVITSNRDESAMRRSTSIEKMSARDQQVYYPKDTAGGSWIAACSDGRVAVLLNGAFQPHVRRAEYEMSRGVLLRLAFGYASWVDFMQHVELVNIEPFTLILKEKDFLWEFRWDGSIKHVAQLHKDKKYAWSSCTLYDQLTQSIREDYWRTLVDQIDNEKLGANNLLEIHSANKPLDRANALVMNRDTGVSTISITQIIGADPMIMIYKDLISEGKLVSTTYIL